jgi:hypothetical protein
LIQYDYDKQGLTMTESKNGEDLEFSLEFHDYDRYEEAIHGLRSYFENNAVHTDVLFYTHSNHRYQVIVRKDYYTEFFLGLFKYRIVTKLEWK